MPPGDLEGGTEPGNFEWASHQNLEFRMEMLRQSEESGLDIWRNWLFKDEDDSLPPRLSRFGSFLEFLSGFILFDPTANS